MSERVLNGLVVGVVVATGVAELFFILDQASHGRLSEEVASRWRAWRLRAAVELERRRTYARERHHVIFEAMEAVEDV